MQSRYHSSVLLDFLRHEDPEQRKEIKSWAGLFNLGSQTFLTLHCVFLARSAANLGFRRSKCASKNTHFSVGGAFLPPKHPSFTLVGQLGIVSFNLGLHTFLGPSLVTG